MKPLIFAVVLMAGFGIISGCNKDSTTTGPAVAAATAPSLVGTWTIVSSSGHMKHLEFRSDNVYYMMNQYAYGVRDLAAGVYQISGNALDLGSNQSPSLYAFSIKNDTLTLVSPPRS